MEDNITNINMNNKNNTNNTILNNQQLNSQAAQATMYQQHKLEVKQKRPSVQQNLKQSSLNKSRKGSVHSQSNSQSRQKVIKDTMTHFIQSTKSGGGSFLGTQTLQNLNLSSSKRQAFRDLSSQRSTGRNEESHTPPRLNLKKVGLKKKQQSKQNQASIHNKPPLLMHQSLKRPETAKNQIQTQSQPVNINVNTAITLRESYPNPSTQNSLNYNQQNQLSSYPQQYQLPQQIVSELESVATPHKSCQTCSKINNFMNNMNSKRGNVSTHEDYSPSDNQHHNHIMSINQIEDIRHHHHHLHNGELAQLRRDLNQDRQYQTLTNSTDTNAFFQKNKTYTPKRGRILGMEGNSNEKIMSHDINVNRINNQIGGSVSRSHSQKKPKDKKSKSKARKGLPALIIDEGDTDENQNLDQNPSSSAVNGNHPYFIQQQVQHPQTQSLRIPIQLQNASASISLQPKLVSLKQLKKVIREGQESLDQNCDEKKQEMMQFKNLLESEIQDYFKQSLNKLMFFKKEIKNDILKLHEDQKRDISQYLKQQQQSQDNFAQAQSSRRDDEFQLQIHNVQRKCESISKEIDLLSQKTDHSSKQIDSLRNKEFYQQANENTLLDKMHTLEQQLRAFKQHTQTQVQSLDDKVAQTFQAQNDNLKIQLKDQSKAIQQRLINYLKEEVQQSNQALNETVKQNTTQQQKKIDTLKKDQTDMLGNIQKDFKEEISKLNQKLNQYQNGQSAGQGQIDDLMRQVTEEYQILKDQLSQYINEKVAQLEQWVSPNQLDEKIEQLVSKLQQDNHQQKQMVTNSLNQQTNEIQKLSKIIQEQESHQELMFNTLQKRFELQIKEELNNRDDQLRELFETEKQDLLKLQQTPIKLLSKEFIQPIQENMLMLDNMLKEYTAAKKQQLRQQTQQQQLEELQNQLSPIAQQQQIRDAQQNQMLASQIGNSSQSNNDNDSYNKFLQQQLQDSNGDGDDNSILRSSVSGTNLNINNEDGIIQGPFEKLEQEESKRYTNGSRSRQQNIMVQDFMKSSGSLQVDPLKAQTQEQLRMTVQSANIEQFKREGVINVGSGADRMASGSSTTKRAQESGSSVNKAFGNIGQKANSVDYNNRNDNYEDVKVEDLEIYSPFHVKGKSESIHSASGSYSENNRFDSINAGHHSSAQNNLKRHKSGKTSHQSIEKTNSDFFNLTQESNIEIMNQFTNSNFHAGGMNSGGNTSLNNYFNPNYQGQNTHNLNNNQQIYVNQQLRGQGQLSDTLQTGSNDNEEEKQRLNDQSDNQYNEDFIYPANNIVAQSPPQYIEPQNQQIQNLSKQPSHYNPSNNNQQYQIDKQFAKIGDEITEEVFINEVMMAFEECFDQYERQQKLQSTKRQSNNNLYLYERIEQFNQNSGAVEEVKQPSLDLGQLEIKQQQDQSKQLTSQLLKRRQAKQRQGAANPMLNIDIEDSKHEEKKQALLNQRRREQIILKSGDKVEKDDHLEFDNNVENDQEENQEEDQEEDLEDDAIDVALASHDYSDRYELSISNNGD